MIVLADADLERAANAAAYYSMQNGGQTCISVERVYVEAPIYDEFVAKVTEKVRALRQGVPGGPGSVDVGAITCPPQIDIVARHVEDARKAGARVARRRPRARGQGPLLRADRARRRRPLDECMTEETFGPTLPIMKVADAEEACASPTTRRTGSRASVWTKDVARGEEIARRIEAGAVCVNDAQLNYLALELPMGGWKASGMG